jgi:hypothetical protein
MRSRLTIVIAIYAWVAILLPRAARVLAGRQILSVKRRELTDLKRGVAVAARSIT